MKSSHHSQVPNLVSKKATSKELLQPALSSTLDAIVLEIHIQSKQACVHPVYTYGVLL